jgi:hypothetical protein
MKVAQHSDIRNGIWWQPHCREKNIVGFIKGLFNLNEEEGEETKKAAIEMGS